MHNQIIKICTKSIATCTAALTEYLHLIICKAHAICREARPHSFINNQSNQTFYLLEAATYLNSEAHVFTPVAEQLASVQEIE